MYKLKVVKVSVDLGEEDFATADGATGMVLLKNMKLKGLAKEIKEYVDKRNGQVIEVSGDVVIFDTTDLTVTAKIEGLSGEISDGDKEQLQRLLA